VFTLNQSLSGILRHFLSVLTRFALAPRRTEPTLAASLPPPPSALSDSSTPNSSDNDDDDDAPPDFTTRSAHHADLRASRALSTRNGVSLGGGPVGGVLGGPRGAALGMGPKERALWRWVNVDDLDAFLGQVYGYYTGKGIWAIALAKLLNLLSVVNRDVGRFQRRTEKQLTSLTRRAGLSAGSFSFRPSCSGASTTACCTSLIR